MNLAPTGALHESMKKANLAMGEIEAAEIVKMLERVRHLSLSTSSTLQVFASSIDTNGLYHLREGSGINYRYILFQDLREA